MSYEEKIAQAKSIIDSFNDKVEDSLKIDFTKFQNALKASGGVTESALASATWEDIGDCGVPKLVAKDIANAFRAKAAAKSSYISERKAQELSFEELFANYNPKSLDTPVAQRLSALARGLPCVVFGQNGLINAKESADLLEEIVDGGEPLDCVIVDEVPLKVLKVGERPASKADENPLFPGEALRGSNQSCAKTHRSWAGIPREARVLLRLALQNGDIRIDHPGRVHDVLDLLAGKTEKQMLSALWKRYPHAKVLYDSKAEMDELPSLKVKKNSPTKRPQDPFYRK